MKNLFLPTPENNYRAKLLSTPALVILSIALLLTNTIIGTMPVQAVDAAVNQEKLLELHNEQRIEAGLPPLRLDPALNNSAHAKAQAMLEADCWSHYCPDGKSPWQFFETAGYEYEIAGENLAEGFFNNEDMVTAWMNSPTHKENILKQDYEEVGFGIVHGDFQGKQGNIVVAVHFGAARQRETTTRVAGNSSLPTPQITNPQDGEAYNTNSLRIEGESPAATQVKIYNQGEEWLTTNPNQGIFTKRVNGISEDSYSINAQSYIGNRESNFSDQVNFTIDRSPDPLTAEDFSVVRLTESQATVNVAKANLSSVNLIIDGQAYAMKAVSTKLWSVNIPAQNLRQAQNIEVTNADKANNAWRGEIAVKPLQKQLQQLEIQPKEGEGRVAASFVKSGVNLGALFLLLLLFGVDFSMLRRTGFTKNRGKLPLHFGLFLVIAIVVLTGTFAGQIGVGLTSL